MSYENETGVMGSLVQRPFNHYPMEFAPITAVRNPSLKAVRDWFTSRTRDGRTLDRGLFSMDALKPHTPTLSLVRLMVHRDEVIDFEVVITAQTIADLFGELPHGSARQSLPPMLFERWQMVLQKVLTVCGPVYSRTRSVAPEGKLRRGEAITLPMVEDGKVTYVVNSTVYGPPEHFGS